MEEHISGNHAESTQPVEGETKHEGQGSRTHGDNSKLMNILSYLGPLVIVTFIISKDDPAVRFHLKQGLVLMSLWIILWILNFVFIPLWMIWNLAEFAVAILAIIGLVHAVRGEEKEVPLVGKFSHYFDKI